MRNKLMIAFAVLSLSAAGCDRKSADSKSHDVEPSNAGSTHVGGGPIDNSSGAGTTGATGTANVGSDDHAPSGDNTSTAHGGSAESLSGGGAKTTEGATGKSMVEPNTTVTPAPGLTRPIETTPSHAE